MTNENFTDPGWRLPLLVGDRVRITGESGQWYVGSREGDEGEWDEQDPPQRGLFPKAFVHLDTDRNRQLQDDPVLHRIRMRLREWVAKCLKDYNDKNQGKPNYVPKKFHL